MPGDVLSVRARHVVSATFTLDVAFELRPGLAALFGPSGAGKSTTLAIIAGLLTPQEGSLRLGDEVWLDTARGLAVPPEARRASLLFQSLALFPHLTALDNVCFGLAHLPRGERRAVAREWLERMRVGSLADRKPPVLSGGEAQRVALARALARRPRVLLLDEPFGSVDEALRATLGAEVVEVVTALGIPTLLVTHDRAEGRRLAEHVIHLEAGRVVPGP